MMTPRAIPPISRRSFLGTVAAGSALAAAVPARSAVPAQEIAGSRILRTIPRTGEPVPAIGMGSLHTFDVFPGGPRGNIMEIMRRFYMGGGRVVDTSPLYGASEVNIGDFATVLGISDELFIANKVSVTGDHPDDGSHARQSFEQSLQRLWRGGLDVVHVHATANSAVMIPLLNAWKREGRIRHLGVSHHDGLGFDALTQWVEAGEIDFVQLPYSIHTRTAEQRVLEAAADQGVAVLTTMPFEKARLFRIVEGRPLPGFAREIGVENWAQFFLKWVIAHPAVTCAVPATTDPDHMSENIGALQGQLPDAGMRARMLRHMEAIPGFAALAAMPPYPDKQLQGFARPVRRSPSNAVIRQQDRPRGHSKVI
jgi:diketogulonate reductase-like aldo/keto reductase